MFGKSKNKPEIKQPKFRIRRDIITFEDKVIRSTDIFQYQKLGSEYWYDFDIHNTIHKLHDKDEVKYYV